MRQVLIFDKVSGLIFFRAGLEKLGYEHALQPYIFTLIPFLGGGGASDKTADRT